MVEEVAPVDKQPPIVDANSNDIRENRKGPKERQRKKQNAERGVKGRRQTALGKTPQEDHLGGDNIGVVGGFETDMELCPLRPHLSDDRNFIFMRSMRTILRPRQSTMPSSETIHRPS